MSEDEPVLRVVRGTPSAEEIAALIAAVSSLSRAPAAPDGDGPSAWVRSARSGAAAGAWRRHRGRDSWRLSGLPR